MTERTTIPPGRGPARGALRLALLGALAAACTTLQPLRAADPQQAATQGEEARAELGGVKVVARADGWRSWPEKYIDQLTPVEVRLVNEGPVPLTLHPDRFALEVEGQPALWALEAGDLPRVLRFQQPPDVDLIWYAGLNAQSNLARSVYPYAWRGLGMAGSVARPHPGHGPDPRPYPLGVLAAGQSATFMLFFDVPAYGLQRYTLAVELTGEGRAPLGEVRLPFQRAESR